MAETRVLDLINSYGIFPQKWKTKEEVDQKAIDSIQKQVLSQITAKDISEHNNFAYSNSVEAYNKKTSNMLATPEIIDFINLIPNEGLVLDLGAGHLRDTLYMVDPNSRNRLNREGMDSSKLEKTLRVVPFEKSKEFLTQCYEKIENKIKNIPTIIEGDFMEPWKGKPLKYTDMDIATDFAIGIPKKRFDGIWSCAAYMVHMAPGKLEESTRGWTKGLKEGGIFAVSYINKKEGQNNIKFLASRSAPGEIKIFSHFNSKEVDEAFDAAGLKLIDRTNGDYTGHGHVLSDFFCSAMYRKK